MKYLLFFLIFILLSCKTIKKINLIGEYVCRTSHAYSGLCSSKIILNSNHSFEYEYHAGNSYTINMRGKWRASLNKKEITFDSYLHSDNDLVKAYEVQNDSINGTKICIYNIDDNSPDIAYVEINPNLLDHDSKKPNTDFDHIVYCKSYNKVLIRELAITYIGAQGKIFFHKVSDTNANEFNIYIKNLSEFHRYFNDQKWKVHHGRLYDPDTIYNGCCRIYYRSKN